MKKGVLLFVAAICIWVSGSFDGYAQVSLDGSMGNTGPRHLQGPDYDIGAEYGVQRGGNLFHSFGQFSIGSGESAVFRGPDSVQNIIGRVTDGSVSHIDGLLRSVIPEADLYLMNPAGLVFGPNAALDINGSFYGTTADYLRMGEAERFYAAPGENELLTVAPPSAFGFLDGDAGPITLQGRGEISKEEWEERRTGLHVKDGQTMALVAGDITISEGTYYKAPKVDKEGNPVYEVAYDSYGMPIKDEQGKIKHTTVQEVEISRQPVVKASEGEIHLISTASAGEIETGGSSRLPEKAGDISIKENALLDVSGEDAGSGSIYIIGGRIVADNSYLFAQTTGKTDGGNVEVHGEDVRFQNGAGINADNFGEGKGADVNLAASGSVTFVGENWEEGRTSAVTARIHEAGNSGSLTIKARDIAFQNGAIISINTNGSGNAGNVTLAAENSVRFTGRGSDKANNRFGGIFAIGRVESSGGNSANITIETGDLVVSDGNHIFTSAYGPGESGNISVQAAGSILLEGTHSGEYCHGWGSTIYTSSNPNRNGIVSGNSGNIKLKADKLIVRDGGYINSNMFAPEGMNGENSGDIEIKANWIQLSGVNPHGENEDGFGSGIYARAKGVEDNVGLGGRIDIECVNLTIQNGAVISSNTFSNKGEENISIKSDFSMNIQGDSSGIELAEPCYSQLQYRDRFGNPDNYSVSGIYTRSENLSEIGYSDKQDISKDLLHLQREQISTQKLKTLCEERSGEGASRFASAGKGGIPLSPDDWLASPPPLLNRKSLDREAFVETKLTEGEERFLAGAHLSAVEIWEEMLPLLDQDSIDYLHTFVSLAYAYQTLGRYQKAEQLFRNYLSDVETSDNRYKKTLFYSSYGDLQLVLGNPSKARKYLEMACRTETGNNLAKSAALQNLGNYHAAEGDYNSALEKYRSSLGYLDLNDTSDATSYLKSKILINMARSLIEKKVSEEISVERLNDAIVHIGKMPDSFYTVFDLISISLLVHEAGIRSGSRKFIQPAFHLLDKALHLAADMRNSRALSLIYGYMGRLYEDEGRFSEAVQLTRHAIAEVQHFGDLRYLWQWQLGRLFLALGNKDKASDAFKQSLDILNPTETDCASCNPSSEVITVKDEGKREKSLLPAGIIHEFYRGYRRKNVFDEKVKSAFLEYADLMMAEAEKLRENEKEAQLYRIRDVMDRLKTSEIQDYFKDECLLARHESVSVEPGTAILYPVSFPDSLVLLLEFADGMELKRVDVGSAVLKDAAKLFRETLDFSAGNYNPGRCLYFAKLFHHWIVERIEGDLSDRNIDTLVIAPDGPLRLVPFSSFYDGQQFLIEKYAIVTIPAMVLTEIKPYKNKDADVLFFGLSESRNGFPELRSVRNEADCIHDLTGARIFLDEGFAMDNLRREFSSENRFVHLATHGHFGESKNDTFLVTHDGRLTADDLERLVNIGRYQENPLELLTLSACQTALGNERAALGLAGIALKAGAASTLATLWSVEDESVYLIICEFYRQLALGKITKAEALRNAQMKIMKEYLDFVHPSYWAPFLLIGNWL